MNCRVCHAEKRDFCICGMTGNEMIEYIRSHKKDALITISKKEIIEALTKTFAVGFTQSDAERAATALFGFKGIE